LPENPRRDIDAFKENWHCRTQIPDSAEHAVARLLDEPDPPTAVVCATDELAVGAHRAASVRGDSWR
jgi:DNA-binding LacI/PurR family transcriptional regulator